MSEIDEVPQSVDQSPLHRIMRLRALLHAISLSMATDYGKIDRPWVLRAYQDLLLGRAWLGKVKGALGVPTPYPESGEVVLMDDAVSDPGSLGYMPFFYDFSGRIAHCAMLRDKIRYCIDQFYLPDNSILHFEESPVVIQLLAQARFSLGFEIAEIGSQRKVYPTGPDQQNKQSDSV
jgi:hypothetical protein